MELSTVYAEQNKDVSPTSGVEAGSRHHGASQKLQWTTLATVHGKNLNIPEASGVYAYAEVTRVQGLPVSVRWVYIGKACNLRNRISNGHDRRFEKNALLRAWLGRSRQNVELWFARVAEADLDVVERSLIASIRPEFNTNLK